MTVPVQAFLRVFVPCLAIAGCVLDSTPGPFPDRVALRKTGTSSQLPTERCGSYFTVHAEIDGHARPPSDSHKDR